MKKVVVFIIVSFVLMSLLFAQVPSCPDQQFPSITSLPYSIDVNQIATDPVSNKKLLLNKNGNPLYFSIGSPYLVGGMACDPDGDLFELTSDKGTIDLKSDGTYTITGPTDRIGVVYITVTLKDKPLITSEVFTRKGTFAIAVIAKNRPPSLCGGLP